MTILILSGSCLAGSAGVLAHSQHDDLIRGFVQRLVEFDERVERSTVSRSEYNRRFDDFVRAEAEYLKPQLPRIIPSIGTWLSLRSDEEMELEHLIAESAKRGDQGEDVLRFMEGHEGKTRSVPRCALASLIGHLGFFAPSVAVEVLFDAIPMPETSEDQCIVMSLRTMGPVAYDSLVEKVLAENARAKVYLGAAALISQARETEFAVTSGLGDPGDWDETFPRSKRKVRALVREWKRWWSEAKNDYSWDPTKTLLEKVK